jgi:NAD-dependent deacetylase
MDGMTMTPALSEKLASLPRTGRIVFLTGAGISRESGISTYRDGDGIWSKVNVLEVATIHAFKRDPGKVLDFYNRRRQEAVAGNYLPNPAHLALARLERDWPGEVLVVTQNVDTLHEQAGQRRVLHMHGRLDRDSCMRCGHSQEAGLALSFETPCPSCDTPGWMRPDVVWFGEMPRHLDEIEAALADCALYCAVGTSGEVYPASRFVMDARAGGAFTLELNIAITARSLQYNEELRGPAGETVPLLVEALLGG